MQNFGGKVTDPVNRGFTELYSMHNNEREKFCLTKIQLIAKLNVLGPTDKTF